MRPIHLKLIACGLTAVCALIILRHFSRIDAEPESEAQKSPTTNAQFTRGSMSPATRDKNRATGRTTLNSKKPNGQKNPSTSAERFSESGILPRKISGIAPAGGLATHDGSGYIQPYSPADTSNAAAPVRGIQLAADVRLPAAIMAQGSMGTDKLAPAVAASLKNISDVFYRELAESFAEGETAAVSEGTVAIPNATNNEATGVIRPGIAVDKARSRANEIYRALYGDDAYNRQVMNSAIEVKLPEDAAVRQP